MFKHLSVSRRVAKFPIFPRTSASFSTGEAQSNENQSNPPPRQKKRGGFFFKLIGATIIGIGGTATACYLNKDVKEYLETSVPYFKESEELLLHALQSSGILNNFGDQKAQDNSTAIEKTSPGIFVRSPAPNLDDQQSVKGSLPLPPIDIGPQAPLSISESTDKHNRIEEDKKKEKKEKKKDKRDDDDEDKQRKKLEKQKKKEEKKKKKFEKLLREKEEEEEKLKVELELKRKALLSDITNQSLALSGVVQSAISAQVNLETKIRQHTSQLRRTLDGDGSVVEGQDSWKAVSAAHDARLQASSDAAAALSRANESMRSQRRLLDKAMEDSSMATDHVFLKAREEMIQREYDLNVAKENARKAENEASSVMIYKDLIEKGKRKFMSEVENIKLDRRLSDKDGKLSEEEWNFLVAHAYKRVEQLLKRIVELELGQKVLVDSAITFQRISDEELAEERIKNELEHQRKEFELEKQKWDGEAHRKFEIELREALTRQSAAHSDHLVHVLRVQREEQNRHFELETREKILKERESFQAAIEKWIARVKGLEIAVEKRAQLEKQGQLSQKLWLACQNLVDSISTSDGTTETIPLREKMTAITHASEQDPVLERIMSEVSAVAQDRGVFSVDALRQRFRRVKTVCKRVSMLDETGCTLIQLGLSWLQSFFIFERTRIYGSEEEVVNFDTFTLLSNAEECVRNGDLETALKFMAQLRGLSRVVADDWINECRLTLEAKLVADAMIAFAGDRSARALLKEEKV